MTQHVALISLLVPDYDAVIAFFTGTIMPDDRYWGLSGEALFSLLVGVGSILLMLAMPVLGAMADYAEAAELFEQALQAFACGRQRLLLVLDRLFALGRQIARNLVVFHDFEHGSGGGDLRPSHDEHGIGRTG